MRWTPHQLLAVFFRGNKAPDPGAVAALAAHNARLAAAGKPPVAPSWLLPKLR
jgi:hypothetical protein